MKLLVKLQTAGRKILDRESDKTQRPSLTRWNSFMGPVFEKWPVIKFLYGHVFFWELETDVEVKKRKSSLARISAFRHSDIDQYRELGVKIRELMGSLKQAKF